MPLNDSKVREIIHEQVQSLEERCARYREVLAGTIDEIVDLERIPPPNIQQQINDKCNAAGRWLATRLGDAPDTGDGERPDWYCRKRLQLADVPEALDGE